MSAAHPLDIPDYLLRDGANVMSKKAIDPKAENGGAVIDALPVMAAFNPMVLVERALNQNASMETLDRLMALEERWQKNQARKAFDKAIAAAKSELPTIIKNRAVDFQSAKGRTNYRYEDLAGIERQVVPVLSKYGLSYRFRTEARPVEQMVIVTCVLSHDDGYYEENSLPGPYDITGNKNAIQQMGSTVTYLERYTLKAALGLAASNDDDGQGAGSGGDQPISAEQMDVVRKEVARLGLDIPKLCKVLRVEKLEDILARNYNDTLRQFKEYEIWATKKKEQGK